MTKSLGQFTGGQLLYWERDDRSMDVQNADVASAISFDTRREMVLFDGNRCHAVTPFDGERYSLVFFTSPDYGKMSAANMNTLVGIGSIWPSEASKSYWASLL